jgi:hypothetical protein
MGERLVLINSVLTNMVLYMIYFFQSPKRVLHLLDYFQSTYFLARGWREEEIPPHQMERACRLKDQGGLGVHDIVIKK